MLERAIPLHGRKVQLKNPTFRQFLRNQLAPSPTPCCGRVSTLKAPGRRKPWRGRRRGRPNASGPDLYAVARRCPLRAAADKDERLPRQPPLFVRYGDRALGLLRKAAERGFKLGGQLSTDPAFSILRSREEFQHLLRESGAK